MATKSKSSLATTEANTSNTMSAAQSDNAQQPQAVVGRPIERLKADFDSGKIPLAGDFAAVIDVAAAGCKAVGIVPGQEAVQALAGLELDSNSGNLKVKVVSPINLNSGAVGIDPSAFEISDGVGIIVAGRKISVDMNALAASIYTGGGSPGFPIDFVTQQNESGAASYFAAFTLKSPGGIVATIIPHHGITLDNLNPANFSVQSMIDGPFMPATRVYGSTSRATVYFYEGAVLRIRVKCREILNDTASDITRGVIWARDIK